MLQLPFVVVNNFLYLYTLLQIVVNYTKGCEIMFVKRLKELRNEKGVSQLKLAEHIKISQQAIAKWETEKSTPDPYTLCQLADYFNVTVDYLLGRPSAMLHESLAEYGQKNKELLDLYYQLNSEGKNKLIEYAQDLINGGRYKKDISSQKIKNA